MLVTSPRQLCHVQRTLKLAFVLPLGYTRPVSDLHLLVLVVLAPPAATALTRHRASLLFRLHSLFFVPAVTCLTLTWAPCRGWWSSSRWRRAWSGSRCLRRLQSFNNTACRTPARMHFSLECQPVAIHSESQDPVLYFEIRIRDELRILFQQETTDRCLPFSRWKHVC
ncbi:hypothetical protein NDU88_006176, partial [Pleurodeles waltl]